MQGHVCSNGGTWECGVGAPVLDSTLHDLKQVTCFSVLWFLIRKLRGSELLFSSGSAITPYTGPGFGDICHNQGHSGYMTGMWGGFLCKVARSEALACLPVSLRVQGSILHTRRCFQPGPPLPSFTSSSHLVHLQGQGREMGLDRPSLTQSKESPGGALSLLTCLVHSPLPAS